MNLYGEGIDPVPFIAAAFCIATVFLGGFTIWIFLQRKKLRLLKEAINYQEAK